MEEVAENPQLSVEQEIAEYATLVKARAPHPVLKTPKKESLARLLQKEGPEKVRDLLRDWVNAAEAMIQDPLRSGYEPENWADADELLANHKNLLICGGNRAGKTRYCARTIMKKAIEKPRSRWLCMHESKSSSIAVQQSNIWDMIPPEWKNLRRNRTTNIHYTQQNGFANDGLVLPNGAHLIFRNYTQEVSIIQGDEFDGAWLDECFTLNWLNEVRFRLASRKGFLMMSVTPIEGYTAAMADVLDGQQVTDWRESELLPEKINVPGGTVGTMPYKGITNDDTATIYFHSNMNKFSPWEEMKGILDGRTKEDIMIRAYGWVDKLSTGMFPKLGGHNVVSAKEIPEQGTNYMILDPAGARNWYMLWARVCPDNLVWVYREWPNYRQMGEWALPDKKSLDGKRGPAQTNGAGRGVLAYRRLITQLEDNEPIFKRFIDPRAGKSASAALREKSQSLISLLKTPVKGESGGVTEPGMLFNPASGITVDEGIAQINSWLDFNPEEPMTFYNQPRLRISADCKNLVWCMTNWQGADPAEKSASKDPVDAMRYLATSSPIYVDPDRSFSSGGGSY